MNVALPHEPVAPPKPRLTRKQKAAVIVRLLLAEGANLKLTDLPEDLQSDLAQQISAMRLVDRDTLHTVAAEFLTELEQVGMAFSGGIDGALALLGGAIGTDTAGRLKRQLGRAEKQDPWQRIASMENEDLLPVLERESIEVCAVILSKLPVTKGAELLGQTPGPRARRMTYAMSLTGHISAQTMATIGAAIIEELDDETESLFGDGPVERVGAILNFSPAQTRDDVLEGLVETDASFAEQVRRAIFTFENIPERINPRDIPRILREVAQPDLVTAIAYARATGQNTAADFVLENMSKRMAEQINEEVSEKGKIKDSEGDSAMSSLIVAIRSLESSGEITLIVEEE